MWRSAVLLGASLLFAGCGEVVRPDGGAGDTGSADAGHPQDVGADDAAPRDTGSQDAEARDLGLTDAQPQDTGAPDAGGPEDVGPATYTLTLTFTGDGAGQVEAGPLGACSSTCTRVVPAGTEVTLTAAPGQRAIFGAFTAPGCGAGPTCAVLMTEDRAVEVRFDALHTITVTPTGDGLGRVDGLGPVCAPGCAADHPTGAALTLTAVPAAGVRFAGWGGACAGNGACELTVSAAHSVEPRWEVITPQLGQAPGGHMCALIGPRSVRCWGNGNSGQLGRGNTSNVGDDESVSALGDLPLGLDIVQLAIGGTHTCVLQKAGSVRCWGSNTYGQLGQGNRIASGDGIGPAPANLPDIDLGGVALQVAMGAWHTCALMADGGVRCWGRGQDGQLGYGSINNVADDSTPIRSPALAGDVPLGEPAVAIGAGNTHTCAVTATGGVKCWGLNASGQLGYPFAVNVGDGNAQRPFPSSAPALPLGTNARPIEVRGGGEHTCVRFADGTVRCWGGNSAGQLGDGTTQSIGGVNGRPLASTSAYVDLQGRSAAQLALGWDHACALTTSGEVFCWGAGEFGKTGYEASANLSSPPGPVLLPALHQGRWLGAGGRSTCVATAVGPSFATSAISCWGWGMTGALGNGSPANVGDAPGTMPPTPSDVL